MNGDVQDALAKLHMAIRERDRRISEFDDAHAAASRASRLADDAERLLESAQETVMAAQQHLDYVLGKDLHP